MGKLQNKIENKEKVMEIQNEIQENNEDMQQHMQNKNDGAIKLKLKRINENQSRTKTNTVEIKESEKGIEMKRRLVGIKRKHDKIDDNQKIQFLPFCGWILDMCIIST